VCAFFYLINMAHRQISAALGSRSTADAGRRRLQTHYR
jgi:hypothetical protein